MKYIEQLRCNCIKDVSMLPICFEAAVPIIIRWVKMEHEELVFEWILEQSGLFFKTSINSQMNFGYNTWKIMFRFRSKPKSSNDKKRLLVNLIL